MARPGQVSSSLKKNAGSSAEEEVGAKGSEKWRPAIMLIGVKRVKRRRREKCRWMRSCGHAEEAKDLAGKENRRN